MKTELERIAPMEIEQRSFEMITAELPFRMTFLRFTQRHVKRQKWKVLPVISTSLAAFPAESRVSKISALWRMGVTI